MDEIPWARLRAPELLGIEGWINSEPLSVEALKGKAVMVFFWSYTNVNCMRTLRYVSRWHEKYSAKGLVIIGVHTPEFTFAGGKENVEGAVQRLKVGFPVALDNAMRTWQVYDNHYWPACFLIDKEGYISYIHFGEGDYSMTEAEIRGALGVKGTNEPEDYPGYLFDQSPDAYFGFARALPFGSGLAQDRKDSSTYIDPGEHELNVIYPHGRWVQEKEHIELGEVPGQISLRFNAREVNLVLEPLEKDVKAEVFIDGKKLGRISIDAARLYNIFKEKNYAERELNVVFLGRVRAYLASFG